METVRDFSKSQQMVGGGYAHLPGNPGETNSWWFRRESQALGFRKEPCKSSIQEPGMSTSTFYWTWDDEELPVILRPLVTDSTNQSLLGLHNNLMPALWSYK